MPAIDELVAAPGCPVCDVSMVRRTNRRTGGDFWGCRRFPVCRGTRNIGSELRAYYSENTLQSPSHVSTTWNNTALDRMRWEYIHAATSEALRSSPDPGSKSKASIEGCLNIVVGAVCALMAAIAWCVVGLLAIAVVMGNPLILLIALAVNSNKRNARRRRRYRRY